VCIGELVGGRGCVRGGVCFGGYVCVSTRLSASCLCVGVCVVWVYIGEYVSERACAYERERECMCVCVCVCGGCVSRRQRVCV